MKYWRCIVCGNNNPEYQIICSGCWRMTKVNNEKWNKKRVRKVGVKGEMNMEIGFCDRCGIQLDKYRRLRIVLDGGDWDNEFELCDECFSHWMSFNFEYVDACWNPDIKLKTKVKGVGNDNKRR